MLGINLAKNCTCWGFFGQKIAHAGDFLGEIMFLSGKMCSKTAHAGDSKGFSIDMPRSKFYMLGINRLVENMLGK